MPVLAAIVVIGLARTNASTRCIMLTEGMRVQDESDLGDKVDE